MADLDAPLRVTYDPAVDAAYVYFQRRIDFGGAARTVPLDPRDFGGSMVNLDLDTEGRLLGIEVLDASKKLPLELLALMKAD